MSTALPIAPSLGRWPGRRSRRRNTTLRSSVGSHATGRRSGSTLPRSALWKQCGPKHPHNCVEAARTTTCARVLAELALAHWGAMDLRLAPLRRTASGARSRKPSAKRVHRSCSTGGCSAAARPQRRSPAVARRRSSLACSPVAAASSSSCSRRARSGCSGCGTSSRPNPRQWRWMPGKRASTQCGVRSRRWRRRRFHLVQRRRILARRKAWRSSPAIQRRRQLLGEIWGHLFKGMVRSQRDLGR